MTNILQESIARTLWVSAYADGIEAGDIVGARPGAREDWFDYCEGFPTEAWDKAGEILKSIPVGIASRWIKATGQDIERFGHCVAMQSLGHGVGLNDDLPGGSDFKNPRLPYIEFSVFDIDILPAYCDFTGDCDR